MRPISTLLGVALMAMLTSAVTAAEHKYLKAFPAAEEGMTRFVIELPHKERGVDNGFRVEIFVGKELLTDGVNLYRMGGRVEAKPLKGWGFTFYELAKFGPVSSTRKAVPPGTPEVKKFVGTSLLIPYNSRIPLVIYAPKGGEVRYRIWKAPEKTEKAKQG